MLYFKKFFLSSAKNPAMGFTLLEISLVLALVVLVCGFSAPFAWSAITQNDLDVAAQTTVNALRRAQNLSLDMNKDTVWSVKLETGKVTVFSGSNFDSRDQNEDEIFELPENFNFSGPTQIPYQKLSGLPGAYGIITITAVSGKSREVSLNSLGVVNY